MPSKIGIFGGTFNPIHLGHLIVADDVLCKFKLDKIIFIPSYLPPHKVIKDTNAKHRYKMVKLAISKNPNFKISPVELNRKGKSYSIDTVKYIQKLYKNKAHIFFILGVDAMQEIHTWKNFNELVDICHFIVVSRPGYDTLHLKKKIAKYLDSTEKVHFMKVTHTNISSTEIRVRIKTGKNIKCLVHSDVEKYIYQHKLYV
ncbi:MAG: nicotinate-nucleotide adenylyltransferase [Candidatus Firestonebacteria bacterium]